MFTIYQICRYLNCMHNFNHIRGFLASSWQSYVIKPTFHVTIFTLYNVCLVLWGVSWVPWGVILSTVGSYLEYRGELSWVPWGISWCTWGISWCTWGDIMMHVGDIMSTVRGKIFTIVTSVDPSGTLWSVIHVWDPPLKQLLLQQQIHWHHVGLRMGAIWKVFLGSFLSIVTAADLSGIIWDPLVQVFSGSFHTVITTADFAGIVWSSIWDPLGHWLSARKNLRKRAKDNDHCF